MRELPPRPSICGWSLACARSARRDASCPVPATCAPAATMVDGQLRGRTNAFAAWASDCMVLTSRSCSAMLCL
eukprot:scaffold4027_cov245-Pinguiococcus_pyrenoidosus.AAC.8